MGDAAPTCSQRDTAPRLPAESRLTEPEVVQLAEVILPTTWYTQIRVEVDADSRITTVRAERGAGRTIGSDRPEIAERTPAVLRLPPGDGRLGNTRLEFDLRSPLIFESTPQAVERRATMHDCANRAFEVGRSIFVEQIAVAGSVEERVGCMQGHGWRLPQ